MSKEALLHIKSKHNGEIPYKYGSNECARLMQSYADQEKMKALEEFRQNYIKNPIIISEGFLQDYLAQIK